MVIMSLGGIKSLLCNYVNQSVWFFEAGLLNILYLFILDGCTDGFEDWNVNSDYCYQSPEEKKTWPDARDFCTTLNGDLAVIKDEVTMNKILEHTQETTWIGLKKDQLEDSKHWAYYNYEEVDIIMKLKDLGPLKGENIL